MIYTESKFEAYGVKVPQRYLCKFEQLTSSDLLYLFFRYLAIKIMGPLSRRKRREAVGYILEFYAFFFFFGLNDTFLY